MSFEKYSENYIFYDKDLLFYRVKISIIVSNKDLLFYQVKISKALRIFHDDKIN